MYEGEEFPVDIKAFIIDKLALIETGISARKFAHSCFSILLKEIYKMYTKQE